jgi:hypothetical protein
LFPRLIEAREKHLLQTPLREGDWLYARERGAAVNKSPVLQQGGAMNLDLLDSVNAGNCIFAIEAPQRVVTQGRSYKMARLVLRHEVQNPLVAAAKRVLGHYSEEFVRWSLQKMARILEAIRLGAIVCPLTSVLRQARDAWTYIRTAMRPRLSVWDIATRCTLVEEPLYSTLPNGPNVEAKTLTLYAAIKPVLPEEMQGIFVAQRAYHLALDEPELVEPMRIAQDLGRLHDNVRAILGPVKGFSRPGRGTPKACQCCGREPPAEGKYRWKKRTCAECRASLRQRGHVTEAGWQLTEGYQVPSCYPGQVQMPGRELPPPAAKWAEVDLGKGLRRKLGIKVNDFLLRMNPKPTDKAKKWRDVEKADLAKLKLLAQPREMLCGLAGICCSGAIPMVSANTNYNRLKALACRVFRPKPQGEPGTWQWAEQFVDYLLPGRLRVPTWERDRWLESMPSHRKRPLRQAAQLLDDRGLRASDAGFKAFVKSEMLPGFSQTFEGATDRAGRLVSIGNDVWPLEEMVDRLIQGPADITHVVAGPVLKPKVEELKKLWHKEALVVYGSATSDVLNRLLERFLEEEGTFVMSDFTMFDNSHSNESWDFMEKLYGANGPEFAQVMAWWRSPRGKIGPFKYQAPVMNASGRDDKSLSNAVLNGFATVLSTAAALREKPLREVTIGDLAWMKSRVVMSVCGDDSLTRVPSMNLEQSQAFQRRLEQALSQFGFRAKVKTTQQFEDAVYLGMRPYPSTTGWRWGRTIGRSTYKMGWLLKPEQRDMAAHITGVADQHLVCSSHVPILADLARQIVKLREGAKRSPVQLDPNKPWEWVAPEQPEEYDAVTLQAVAGIYTRASGVPVGVQDLEALIRAIRSVEVLPAVIDSSLWRLIIANDEL